ncbi:MAG: hypothetical protein EZS28_047549 [Streblomastix strix]|uniref:Uncharacterized protein n=1 Tax=Streblomastix strix TaxID=222440 RepID=A0A5J4TGM1_9EUKA|nr:MAG: hypothetical protein EZS28_047549 [Streblomastix strix]
MIIHMPEGLEMVGEVDIHTEEGAVLERVDRVIRIDIRIVIRMVIKIIIRMVIKKDPIIEIIIKIEIIRQVSRLLFKVRMHLDWRQMKLQSSS